MIRILLNPFERIAGLSALLAGLGFIFITALVAALANIHLDGVLDMHMQGSSASDTSYGHRVTIAVAEGLINWLSISCVLLISALLFSKSRFRWIDIFGTQALARFPYLIVCIFSWLLFSDKMTQYIEAVVLKNDAPPSLSALDILQFILSTVISLACLVWLVVLMYKAYSVSCNLKGNKAVVSFIVSLLVAEIISKLVLNYTFL